MLSMLSKSLNKFQRLIAVISCIAALQLSYQALAASEVYREVDESGVPSFSDQNTPGARKIQVKEPSTFDSEAFAPPEYEYKSKAQGPREAKYEAKIVSPVNDSAIRDNAGNLTINVSIEPALAPGHGAALLMDGVIVQQLIGAGGLVSLSNVDRGTHALSVKITNAKGRVIESSPVVSVTLLRHSRQ